MILCFNKPRATNSKNGARHCSVKSNFFGQDNIAVSRARRHKITVLCPFDVAAFSCSKLPPFPPCRHTILAIVLRKLTTKLLCCHFSLHPASRQRHERIIYYQCTVVEMVGKHTNNRLYCLDGSRTPGTSTCFHCTKNLAASSNTNFSLDSVSMTTMVPKL